MADWARYLLVSGGDPNRIQWAAQQLSEAGFDVVFMQGAAFAAGDTVADLESVRPMMATMPPPLALDGGEVELRSGPVRIDVPGRQLWVGSDVIDVTTSEFNLCVYLIRNLGRVVSKRELVKHLRGSDHYSANLVEAIVSTLRRKLGPDAAAIVETVRGVGYIVRSDATAD